MPLNEIPKHTLSVILAAEDNNFYAHSGVDYAAAFRALWQNITSFKRISGASTISMQLAGMSMPRSKHGLVRKFIQSAKARKMEKSHSKDEILCEYMNRIPFGGKIYGIEAAAQYYFGLPASKLNQAESALLCGLPQKPNKFRPDRFPESAKERQKTVLHLLARRGAISEKEAERILKEEPIRLRDFKYKASFEYASDPAEMYHAFRMADGHTHTSLDREIHHKILELMRQQKNRLKNVRDGAAILIDSRTGKILTLIGTLDFSHGNAGQVDVVHSIRSAGSSLKPFIYAEAIAGGKIVASTKILDAPVRYGDYSPANYDNRFRGMVSAKDALASSLNTPAVRLVAMLGEERVRETFHKIGLKKYIPGKQMNPGLSLALGADGYRMADIAAAYLMLANNGMKKTPTLDNTQTPDNKEDERVFPESAAFMISIILRSHRLAYSALDVAWKTGTSNNNCDAWCFAYTPDYTLGVWFGNKNGENSPDLVGAVAAVPAASEIFDYLYANTQPPVWPEDTRYLELREFCAESGLTPGIFCTKRNQGLALPGMPLQQCTSCSNEKIEKIKILKPAPKNYHTERGSTSIHLLLETDKKAASWFLNDRYIGDNLTEYDFETNKRHTLRVMEKNPSGEWNQSSTAEIIFSVQSK